MGGRAAYTLGTAAFIGVAGLTGTFAYLYQAIPGPAILPILVFIGLEITAQSFHATPQRHYPAVAIACVPALSVQSIPPTTVPKAKGITIGRYLSVSGQASSHSRRKAESHSLGQSAACGSIAV